ncbi:MAG TPA: cytochrome c3 family protein, partial [Candidatus Limnocylindrales bacterium]
MRRLALLLAGGAVWLFLFAIPALADGGVHVAGQYAGTTTDFCAGCHRAHSAPQANLLLKAQPGLCYTCHGAGGQGAQNDVQDGVYYTLSTTTHVSGAAASGALRGGGFDFALVGSNTYTGSPFTGGTIGLASAPVATSSHHSVDGSPVTLWGNGPISTAVNYGEASVNLTCGSCHDPHGNHQYRILKPGPSDSGIANFSFQAGYSNGGRVFINDATTKTYTTTNYMQIDAGDTSAINVVAVPVANSTVGQGWSGGPYDGSQVAFNTATKNWYGRYQELSSRWCATCHTRYFGQSGSAVVNSGDAVFTYKHAEYNLVDPANTGVVAASTAAWPAGTNNMWLSANNATVFAPIVPVTGTLGTGSLLTSHAPKCLTCHLSHGTDAAMTSVITNQFSPGVNFDTTGTTQVIGPLDVNNDRNVGLGSTL